MKTFCCRYYYEGSWWALDIKATDWQDAERRVSRLGNLQLLGELKATIPASVLGAGWFVRAVCAVRNFFSKGVAA